MSTTTNRLNRFPAGTVSANVPVDIGNLANDLDNVANIYTGTLAARPAATAAAGHAGGNPGSFYYATDTKELFVSLAAAWIKVTTEPGVPLGAMVPYGGSGDPADTRYLLADGRALSRTVTYTTLFAVLGTTYGTGDGSTTFNIPDKRGRVGVGADNMGTAAGAAGRLPNNNRARGQNGGSERNVLTVPNMPPEVPANLTQSVALGWLPGTQPIPGRDVWAGSGTPVNNLQPYEVENYLVRVL